MRYLKVVGNRPNECVKSVGHYARPYIFKYRNDEKIIIYNKIIVETAYCTRLCNYFVVNDCLL